MKKLSLVILCILLPVTASIAEKEPRDSMATADLGEIDRRLNSPLTDLWSLTFQNNTGVHEGDAIAGSVVSNNLFFQPFLPFEVGAHDQVMLTLRPVFPLVTQPVFDPSDPLNLSGHETGFGDIQLLTLAGPNKADGLLWGAGVTFRFPTASGDVLGQGKYQAGPAAMLFHMGKPWMAGILAQHWKSFAGDSDRADANRTDLQYVIRRSMPGAMSIGMGPTVSIDWEAEPENRVTFPIGLGITKTTRWNKTPVKLRVEAHYSIIKPEDYGTTWNLRLQVTPVIPSPFK
jgi:hypothetical protein